MTTLLWILVVDGGAIILGYAIAFALLTNRRLSRREHQRRIVAVLAMYSNEGK